MRDMKFKRGQIWWMEGYEVHKEGARTRPALVISNDDINSNPMNLNITVIPITSNVERQDIKTNILFNRHTRAKNIIKCGEVVTIYKSQLVSYESAIDEELMEEVEKALKYALGLGVLESDAEEIKFENIINEVPKTSLELNNNLEIKNEEDEEKEDLINYQIQKAGSKIKWSAENEALFMKTYTEQGIDKVCEIFNTNKDNVNNRAHILSKKYPDFKTKRNKGD